ncbi:probable LRR receptor-like serine/threonine-protein kinase At3g47570 isoform X3 [Durio zibethinus]|nr:probable LRR receptor-like serine/threonine-protein kinase At3g47570 isoform X3 [Durio zibethinus]
MNLLEQVGSKSFLKECKTLRNVRRRNLVKRISACSGIDFQGNPFKALIYEFMPNRSLEGWLHAPKEANAIEPGEPKILNFPQRLNIAIDVASALDYLHHHCEVPVVHCDLKPSNILLDHDTVAHVGDSGLARFSPKSINNSCGNSTSSLGLKGTVGYAAPSILMYLVVITTLRQKGMEARSLMLSILKCNSFIIFFLQQDLIGNKFLCLAEYGIGTEATTSGDMYSFGILLLEMFTGKRPTDDMFKDDLTLHHSTKMALSDQVLEVVDPLLLAGDNEEENANCGRNPRRTRMQETRKIECLISILGVGIACSVESPKGQMDSVDAATQLRSIGDKFLGTRIRTHREARV